MLLLDDTGMHSSDSTPLERSDALGDGIKESGYLDVLTKIYVGTINTSFMRFMTPRKDSTCLSIHSGQYS